MNPKRARFVTEYLKDANATQAAIRAGYSKKTAGSQGHDLLKEPEISEAIGKRTEKAAMSADEVLQGLAEIARDGKKDSDKVSALGLLGKHHKLFTDKTELSGSVRVSIAINGIKRGGEGLESPPDAGKVPRV